MQLHAVFYPPQFYFTLSKSIAFVPLIFHIIRRGGFEALPPSTALYFKGIYDCAPTMPQANFSFILYIFFSILRVKSSPYPVRDSKPIYETLKAFIFKVFSVF